MRDHPAVSSAVAPAALPPGPGRGALAVPNFRTYFVGSAISMCGAWLLRTAQAWLVLDLTGSPAALGVVTIAQYLPVTILSLFAGVFIDRLNTRALMIAVQAIIGGQAAVMAVLVLTHQIQFWEVLVLAAIQGTASAIDLPIRSTVVSELVSPALVSNGIAVNSSLNSGARIIGPGIGGLLIGLWGNGICFAVTAVAYLAAIATLLVLRTDQFYPRRRASHGPVLGQLWDGLLHSFSTPSLGFNMVLAAFIGTFAYNWAVVLPLLARFALGMGPQGFGALNMAMGIGSTIGAVLMATRVRSTLRVLFLAAAAYSVLVLAVAGVPSLLVAFPVLVMTGIASVAYSASSNTLVQTQAAPEFRGRVLSLWTLLLAGSTPLGGGFTGLAADHWSVRVALVVNGLFCIVGTAAALLYWRVARARAPHVPPDLLSLHIPGSDDDALGPAQATLPPSPGIPLS